MSKEIIEQSIEIHKEVPEGVETKIDQNRIKFVVQVFIENAINYSPHGGSIFIKVSRDASKIVFSVRDNGIGLSNDDLEVIFSKFYRGHNARLIDTEGMGIGLYISQKIIERHGGHIWAESEGLNKGSTFYFSIPGK